MVLAVCCVSVLLVGIDMTAVNLALPSIGRDFHTGASGLSWIIDAYTLVLATFLMFSASTADRIGRELVFRIGLGTFVVGSALCAIAPSLGWLIAFRALQGLGGSMLNPVAMAILSSVYPHPADRAKAIGVWSGVIGLSLALGPIVGGALVDSPPGWRGIFLINLPIGLAAIVVATRVTPESKAAKPRKGRPGRPDADRADARRPGLRRHRGSQTRLELTGDHCPARRRGRRAGRIPGRRVPGGTSRYSTRGSSAACRSPRPTLSPCSPSAPSARSSTSTASTCKTRAATARSTPGC